MYIHLYTHTILTVQCILVYIYLINIVMHVEAKGFVLPVMWLSLGSNESTYVFRLHSTINKPSQLNRHAMKRELLLYVRKISLFP